MSITITINNAAEKIADLLKERFSEEQLKFFELWKTSDNDASFDAYQENILPIVNAFEVDIANGNFKIIFEMLGYSVNVFDGKDLANYLAGEEIEEKTGEIESNGSFEGGELEIFKSRIKNLLKVVRKSPNEFKYNSTDNNINGVHVIDIGKDSSYYEDRLVKILQLCEKTNKIIWY
jgi:hypothetical protein